MESTIVRYTMIVERNFLPVGQGAFYCEHFHFDGMNKRINLVYDCGSSTGKSYVENQIKREFALGEEIHAVFLSHLDTDHINGLEFLLKRCVVKKIFFPLLTQQQRNCAILCNLVDNSADSNQVNRFIENPYAYFDSLDIRVRPRLYQISQYDEEEEYEFNGIDAQILPSGDNLANIILDSELPNKVHSNWYLIPFNFKWADRIKLLEQELYNRLGRYVSNEQITHLWKNGTAYERWQIKDAYNALPGNLNTNAMTLFSGAMGYDIRQCATTIQRRCVAYKCKRYCCYGGTKASGCLYMGDYEAAGRYKWMQLEHAYQLYWQYIGCIQVPHHGSSHNYNTKLSQTDAFFVISAGSRNRWKHPHAGVIRDILGRGKQLYLVTEKGNSKVSMIIHR